MEYEEAVNSSAEASAAEQLSMSLPMMWPMHGQIQFQDVVLRYNAAASPALAGLCLYVECGQKLGICGRTGQNEHPGLYIIMCILGPDT